MYVMIGIIGLFSGLLSIYLGSNILYRKNVFSNLECMNCEKKIQLFKLKCKCGFNNQLIYISAIFVTVILYLATLYYYGYSSELYVGLLFVILMVSVSVSDILRKIVPDELIVVFLIVLGILRIFIYPNVWFEAYLGMVVGFGLFYAIAYYGEKVYKQEVMGGGDIKLYAIIGLVLGVKLTLLSIFFASFSGLVYAIIFKKDKEEVYLPFVPFITFGVFVSYFYGNIILVWYTSLF
ncbi:A24 family peptidase [Mycoplasmatota bacterium WC44]